MNRLGAQSKGLLEARPKVLDPIADVAVKEVGTLVAVDAGLEEGVFASVEGLAGEGDAEGEALEDGRVGDLAWRSEGLQASRRLAHAPEPAPPLVGACSERFLHLESRTQAHLGVPEYPLDEEKDEECDEDPGAEASGGGGDALRETQV